MWNTPTKKRLSKIPKLYETEGVALKDKLIYLHFFIGDCDRISQNMMVKTSFGDTLFLMVTFRMVNGVISVFAI